MLIKPFVYAVCDTNYQRHYAKSFCNSARAFGHEAEVFCDGKEAIETSDGLRYCVWRFQMLPELLKQHPHVLMVDIDSVFAGPFEVHPDYDLGIFLRPYNPPRTKTLCSVFYCTDKAIEFAEAVARECEGADTWMDDQAAVWRVYEAMGERFRIKRLDENHVSWRGPTAPVWTGKGCAKVTNNEFRAAVLDWARRE